MADGNSEHGVMGSSFTDRSIKGIVAEHAPAFGPEIREKIRRVRVRRGVVGAVLVVDVPLDGFKKCEVVACLVLNWDDGDRSVALQGKLVSVSFTLGPLLSRTISGPLLAQ